MELYHIHLLGNHDRLYNEGKEFVVDKNKFNNRLYNRVYEANSTVDINRYKELTDYINYLLISKGYQPFDSRINLGEIIDLYSNVRFSSRYIPMLLEDSKKIAFDQGINLREMAMEEYRKENCSQLPSRMHSLFACSSDGIEYWSTQIHDSDADIYRIDAFDEPFVSNDGLLPDEGLCYGDKIQASYRYYRYHQA